MSALQLLWNSKFRQFLCCGFECDNKCKRALKSNIDRLINVLKVHHTPGFWDILIPLASDLKNRKHPVKILRKLKTKMLDANFIATTAPHMYQGEVYLLVSKRTIPHSALVLHPLLLLSQHWVNPLSFSKLLKLALKLKVLTEKSFFSRGQHAF